METLDREHGDAVAAWEKMGRPDPPNPAQTKVLQDAAWDTKKEILRADRQGRLYVERSVDAWNLVLLKQL